MNLDFIKRKEFVWLMFFVVLFVLLHLPGLSQPYHQDEYKWPMIVNPALTEPGGIPHPPVGEFIYRQAGQIIGYDNFRVVPFIFGFLNLFLLFYLSKTIFNLRTALWVTGLFTISFYSLLASLMVDTDGAIMPFFFLLSAIAYYKLRVDNFSISKQSYKWLALLTLSIIFGFLVKVSFFLVPAAFALDFLIYKKVFSDKKLLIKYLLLGLGVVIFLVAVLLLAKIVFPFFDISKALKYWEHFANFNDRGWGQTLIQFIKAIFYLSPLLVFTPFLADKEIIKSVRPFVIFIVFGLIFYILLFDFSIGALDRYFQFLIIPLCVISGAVFAKYIECKKDYRLIYPLIISGIIILVQFVYHFVPSLHPKSEWIGMVISLKWNFLYPFSGGSGPLGFYISFAFIGLFWISSFVIFLTFLNNRDIKKYALLALMIFGLFYNAVFIEEYLFGKINGYAPALVRESAEYIKNNPDIKKVVVYNDNGGDEIRKTGKYERRLYATPQFEKTYREFFENFSGHILLIDIPKIGTNNFYSNYIQDYCKNIYETKDKYITANILECQK